MPKSKHKNRRKANKFTIIPTQISLSGNTLRRKRNRHEANAPK